MHRFSKALELLDRFGPQDHTLRCELLLELAEAHDLTFSDAVYAAAARSRGARALAQDLLGTAQMATENLIERYVRPEQTKGRRRMPYSYHRRIVYL